MGPSGAMIMGFFGALFASLTLLLQQHWSGLGLELPFMGFVIIAAGALVAVRLPGDGFARPPGSGRIMMWSSIGEGVALFLINQLAVSFGRSDLILPGMTVVVGLHFVPIAYWAPFRPLYVLAAVITGGGALGLLLPQPIGGTVAGFTAAAALAAASAAAVRREWTAKTRWR